MASWIVMAGIEVRINNGVSFEKNAVGLTEKEAEAEAARRNQVEKEAGHIGILWFPSEDPMVAIMKKLGGN